MVTVVDALLNEKLRLLTEIIKEQFKNEEILVLQLAWSGDIYYTWPVLRALRRRHPDAEIHFWFVKISCGGGGLAVGLYATPFANGEDFKT